MTSFSLQVSDNDIFALYRFYTIYCSDLYKFSIYFIIYLNGYFFVRLRADIDRLEVDSYFKNILLI